MSEKDEDFSIDPEPQQAGFGTSPEGEEEYLGDVVKKLKDKLRQAEEKAKEYLDGWQRERADIANARRRDEDSRQEFVKFANAGLLEELIPVLDSFTLAAQHGNPEGKPAASNGASKELEVIHRQLLQILKQHGLEEDNPLGLEFDPRRHEAVGVVNADKIEDENKILEVVQKGYILSGKIIRPSKVKIGQING